MKNTSIGVILFLAVACISSCSDEQPSGITLSGSWSLEYRQYGTGFTSTLNSNAKAGFSATAFLLETDTVWTKDAAPAHVNMKVILSGDFIGDTTCAGTMRIQEKAYGIDDTRPVTMAFTRDRRAFLTEPVEIRDQDNNLLATLQLKGNEK